MTNRKPPTGPTAYLCCKDAARALAFYAKAFGAVEVMRYTEPAPDGRIGHAELELGAGYLMLADEYPEIGFRSPTTLGGTPVLLHLEVADVDAVYQRALDAGATVHEAPADKPQHDRRGRLVDPFGHIWILSGPTKHA
jgi:PhnB protein